MKVYLVERNNTINPFKNGVWEGKCFSSKEAAEKYVKNYNEKIKGFNEIFSISAEDFNALVGRKLKQTDFDPQEYYYEEEIKRLDEELIVLIAEELNISLELSREMLEFDQLIDNSIAKIIEIEVIV